MIKLRILEVCVSIVQFYHDGKGLLFGTMTAAVVMPYVSFGTWDLAKRRMISLICLGAIVAAFVIILTLLYTESYPNCRLFIDLAWSRSCNPAFAVLLIASTTQLVCVQITTKTTTRSNFEKYQLSNLGVKRWFEQVSSTCLAASHQRHAIPETLSIESNRLQHRQTQVIFAFCHFRWPS